MADGGLTARAEAAFGRLFRDATGVLAAVSGGPDSMALLALLARWAERLQPALAIHAATVDHGLRSGSFAEAQQVAAYAAGRGLPHVTLRWLGEKPSAGLQEAARDARYNLLSSHAQAYGLSHLVTAHHADDQAETVLLRLCAGSGVGGLAGMRERMGRGPVIHVRPLLDMTKAELLDFCAAEGIAHVSDPSNAQPRFGRVRMRRLMPLLAAEGLTPERLVRLAKRAARAEDALNAAAAGVLEAALLARTACLIRLDWRRVQAAPIDIRLRVLAEALRRSIAPDASVRLEGLESLLDAVDAAAGARERMRRTLAGRVVTLLTGGVLTVAEAPPRRSVS